jgi:hypothetical protein
MVAPATLVPPPAPKTEDDLDAAALMRWWAQVGAQTSSGKVTRRLRYPTAPDSTPASPIVAASPVSEADHGQSP